MYLYNDITYYNNLLEIIFLNFYYYLTFSLYLLSLFQSSILKPLLGCGRNLKSQYNKRQLPGMYLLGNCLINYHAIPSSYSLMPLLRTH